MKKNTYRLLISAVSAIFLFLLIHFSFSYETVVDNKIYMDLPAAVFISSDSKLSFDYPDIFKAYSRDFAGGEIKYHVDLLTSNPNIHGYVEVWHTLESLDLYLERAKAAFSPSIRNFQETFPQGGSDPREWIYDVQTEQSGEIHVRQQFQKKDGDLIVISLFAPKKIWSEKYDTMFEEIRNSTKLLD